MAAIEEELGEAISEGIELTLNPIAAAPTIIPLKIDKTLIGAIGEFFYSQDINKTGTNRLTIGATQLMELSGTGTKIALAILFLIVFMVTQGPRRSTTLKYLGNPPDKVHTGVISGIVLLQALMVIVWVIYILPQQLWIFGNYPNPLFVKDKHLLYNNSGFYFIEFVLFLAILILLGIYYGTSVVFLYFWCLFLVGLIGYNLYNGITNFFNINNGILSLLIFAMPIGYTFGYSAILLIGFTLFLLGICYKGLTDTFYPTDATVAATIWDKILRDITAYKWPLIITIVIVILLLIIGSALFAYKPNSTKQGNYTGEYVNGSISLFVIAGIIAMSLVLFVFQSSIPAIVKTLFENKFLVGFYSTIFISVILGIYILIYSQNRPNNPNIAMQNILTIFYTFIAISGFMSLYFIYKHWNQLPSLLKSGISYSYKLFFPFLWILLFMTAVNYFYNYGGLLTIFAKRDFNGNYDTTRNPTDFNNAVDQINTYKNKAMIVLVPLTILIGFYLFYKMYKTENAEYDIIFDRVKNGGLIILFISFLMQIWTLNPTTSTFHDTIREYFSGNILVFIILFLIFGGLFAGTHILKRWLNSNNTGTGTGTDASTSNSNNTGTSTSKEPDSYTYLASLISFFILFITTTSIGLWQYYFNPKRSDDRADDNDSNKKEIRVNQAKAGGAITLIIVVSAFWLGFIGNELNRLKLLSFDLQNVFELDTVLQILRVIFGLLFSSLLIYISVVTINGLSKPLGGLHLVINLIMVIIVFIIMYKMLKIDTNPKVYQTYHLLLDTFFYIPCLFITLYDNLPMNSIFGLASSAATAATSGLTSSGLSKDKLLSDFTHFSYLKILVGVILLYLGYFYYLKYSSSFINQNGNVILTTPISLNLRTRISGGDYITLNKYAKNTVQSTKTNDDKTTIVTSEYSGNKYNYNYAFSFWVYLDSTNSNVDKDIIIFDYGKKPQVTYNPFSQTLKVSMWSTGTTPHATDFDILSAETLKTVYESTTLLLQKWNNIIINYLEGGTLDIFINGELVQSNINITPFMQYDALIVGQDGGLNGGICNIIYFIEALTSRQIYYLYTMLKDFDPPLNQTTGKIMYNIANHK